MAAGVPANIAQHLEQFVGAELTLVGLGQHQIQFHFMRPADSSPGRDPSLSVEGRWTLHDRAGHLMDEERSYWARDVYRVHALLGQRVASVEASPPTSFALCFEAGYRLAVFATPGGYESFSIQPGDVFG